MNTSARERERAERRRWRKKRRRASEQTRSIETDREQGDYVCEVRRREAARQNLSISANRKATQSGGFFYYFLENSFLIFSSALLKKSPIFLKIDPQAVPSSAMVCF